MGVRGEVFCHARWQTLFILHTKPRSNLIKRHSTSSQSFADDAQLLDSCHPNHLDTTVQRMQNCISEVKSWMDCNKLKLNNDKIESILIKPDSFMLPDSAPTSIRVGNSDIPLVTHVRNLRITISSNTTMDMHVTNIYRPAHAELRRISSIRSSSSSSSSIL